MVRDALEALGEELLAAVDEALATVGETPQRFPRVHEEPDFAIRRAQLRRSPMAFTLCGMRSARPPA